jgi:hypothetical protein
MSSNYLDKIGQKESLYIPKGMYRPKVCTKRNTGKPSPALAPDALNEKSTFGLVGQSAIRVISTYGGVKRLYASPERIRAVSNLSATASASRVTAIFMSVFFSSWA